MAPTRRLYGFHMARNGPAGGRRKPIRRKAILAEKAVSSGALVEGLFSAGIWWYKGTATSGPLDVERAGAFTPAPGTPQKGPLPSKHMHAALKFSPKSRFRSRPIRGPPPRPPPPCAHRRISDSLTSTSPGKNRVARQRRIARDQRSIGARAAECPPQSFGQGGVRRAGRAYLRIPARPFS